ncbi:predicted protein [Thalassiosira pseudonana CCMP1335]|uniref:HTH myb-type domain-containing protein n=1 Tax=Thalassiosira pseudonana TaxID=35128 RepID=B8BU81_THAPS|nr:predicted protein [Thalassiosira pseudonana CCMP1335]EED95238.1 predicted protein [Thalassiosira pseudonana CCMP1335]
MTRGYVHDSSNDSPLSHLPPRRILMMQPHKKAEQPTKTKQKHQHPRNAIDISLSKKSQQAVYQVARNKIDVHHEDGVVRVSGSDRIRNTTNNGTSSRIQKQHPFPTANQALIDSPPPQYLSTTSALGSLSNNLLSPSLEALAAGTVGFIPNLSPVQQLLQPPNFFANQRNRSISSTVGVPSLESQLILKRLSEIQHEKEVFQRSYQRHFLPPRADPIQLPGLKGGQSKSNNKEVNPTHSSTKGDIANPIDIATTYEGGYDRAAVVVAETKHKSEITNEEYANPAGTTTTLKHSTSTLLLSLVQQQKKQRARERKLALEQNPPRSKTAAPQATKQVGVNTNIIMPPASTQVPTTSVVRQNTSTSVVSQSTSGTMHNPMNAPAAQSSSQEPTATASASSQPGHEHSRSVVPDLMEVYDALTQSSTPQVSMPSSVGGAPATNRVAAPASAPTVYLYSNTGGKQLPNPPSLPPVSSQGSNSSSNRRASNRKSSSNNSEGSTSSVKRKSGVAPKRATKKIKSEDSDGSYKDPSESNHSRKKAKATGIDNRWSKRFTWPDELHRDFVSAIFDVGLKHSSPSAILEYMAANPDLTSERVKSHLQKYRLNRQKSKKEFMMSYDSALDGFRTRQQCGEDEEDGGPSISCGETAARCTHYSINEARADQLDASQRSTPVAGQLSSQAVAITATSTQIDTTEVGGAEEPDGVATLQMPLLTAVERDSPLGQSFGYLVGMFQTLTLQLEMNRQQDSLYQQQQGHSHHGQGYAEQNGQIQLPHYAQHQQQITYLEQAVVNAASMQNDPSIHEVAAAIPHAVLMGGAPPQRGQIMQNQMQQFQQTAQVPQHGYTHQDQQDNHHQMLQQHHQQPRQHATSHGHNAHGAPSPLTLGTSSHNANPGMQYPTQPGGGKPQFQGQSNATASVPCPLDAYDHSTQTARVPPQAQGALSQAASLESPNTNAPAAASSGRTLQAQQESMLMKQEMKSQKTFQNKMRALKQVELSKYGGHVKVAPSSQATETTENTMHSYDHVNQSHGKEESAAPAAAPQQHDEDTENFSQQQHSPIQHPHTGEELDQDFWNSEDVNDQLFDFLMD